MSIGNVVVELCYKNEYWWTLPDRYWQRQQFARTICPECGVLLREALYPQPVSVPLIQLEHGLSRTTVAGVGILIVHVRLLTLIEPYMRDAVVGRCFWKDGSVLDDYRTLYFRNVITPLADPEAPHYSCSVCRLCADCAEVSDKQYVLRADLPEGSEVFESRGALYVSESLAEQIPWLDFPDIRPQPVPIRNEILSHDPMLRIRQAIDKLTSAYGHWPIAFSAVEEEARRYRLPDGVQAIYVEVGGFRLEATGHVSKGIMRVNCIAMAQDTD